MNLKKSILISLSIHALMLAFLPAFGGKMVIPDWVEVSVVAYPDKVAKMPHWQSGKKFIPNPSNEIAAVDKTIKNLPINEYVSGLAVEKDMPSIEDPSEQLDISPFSSNEKILPGIDRKLGKLENEGQDDVADISGPITRRNLIRKIYPKYPVWAEEKGIEGSVKLKFWVSSEGIVRAIELLETSGYPDFDSRAIEALKKYIFSPMGADQTKEEQWGTIVIKYTLK